MSEKYVENLRQKVEMLRPLYDKCVKMESGEDPAWEVKKKAILHDVIMSANSFKNGTSDNAAYVLGRISAKLDELGAPRMQILEFEGLQKRYLDSIKD